MDKYINVQDIVEALGIDRKTVIDLFNSGQLPAFKVGKRWKVKQSDFDAYIERQYAAQAQRVKERNT